MYAYAGSSPTNLIDPLGFTSLLPEAPGSDYDPMLGPFGGDDEIGPPLPPTPEPCDDGTDNPNGDEEDGTGRGGPNATGPSEEDIRQLIALITDLADRLGLSTGPLDLVDWEAIRAFIDWLREACWEAREDVTTDRIPIVDQMSIWDRATFAVTGFVIAISGGPAGSNCWSDFWDDRNEYVTCTNVAAGAGIVGGAAAVGAGGLALVGALGAEGAVAARALNPVAGLPRIGSALKLDAYHTFPALVDNFAVHATPFLLRSGAVLYQLEGSYRGKPGRFEWIVNAAGFVTHRLFVEGKGITGVPMK